MSYMDQKSCHNLIYSKCLKRTYLYASAFFISLLNIQIVMDRDRPETIHEDVESAIFANRENVNPQQQQQSVEHQSSGKDSTPNR